jgi:hypothetical protein
MSLSKLHEAVVNTAQKAYMQKDTQDILNMAAATLQMAQAYQLMKECELHEKFHQAQEDHIFGEDSLKGPDIN